MMMSIRNINPALKVVNATILLKNTAGDIVKLKAAIVKVVGSND